jgi:uncharacterized oligopeptide transporter (OPT) family protein
VALAGGLLGVMFMVPLRRAVIVKERATLPFPEGEACAQVLKAGEEGGFKAKLTFIGLETAALYKFVADGLKIFPSEVDYSSKSFNGVGFGIDDLPALLGVSWIVGPRILSSYTIISRFVQKTHHI